VAVIEYESSIKFPRFGVLPMRHSHPSVLVVDDDPSVLRALRPDLIVRYGEHLHVIAVNSPAERLRTLLKPEDRAPPW
jgi:hypothetical protein